MKHRSYSILPKWLLYSLFAIFFVTGISVSALFYFTASAFWATSTAFAAEVPEVEIAASELIGNFEPIVIEDFNVQEQEQPAVEVTATAAAVETAAAASERVTILLMGIDRRPGEPFVSRTDTMMLLSIDPETNSAAMLSVPRDLYVEIPGHGRNRINTAFVYGAQNGGPAGGAALAMETVSYNLGVPIDHFMMVDFSAFVRSIDAIGGIDVYVPRELYDAKYPDMNYGYDPLYVPAGDNHFDGALALKYARTRYVDNDFGRAGRQQQVVLAVRNKMLSLGVNQALESIPALYQHVSEGVRTDLSLNDIVALATVAGSIPSENIRSGVLDTNYVYGTTTAQGAQVLILENDKAAVLINELFFN